MTLYTVDSLVTKLLNENKNVFIIDTCCLLDIVRVPIREPNIHPLMAALQIIAKGTVAQNYTIVFPSFIPIEWTDNISNVCDEVSRAISKVHSGLTYFDRIFLELGITLTLPDLMPHGIESQLRDISKCILDDFGLTLQEDEHYHGLGFKRSARKIAPARPGKDSLKDCVIFEETLAIGKKLRSLGFSKKIIFSSSNTKEYEQDEIIQFLEEDDIIYSKSLNMGLYLADS